MAEVIIGVLAAIAGWILTLVGKTIKDKKKEEEIIQALKIGVDNTEARTVELWRGENGKLTKEQQAEARSQALAIAREELSKPALKLLSTWSQERIFSWIDSIVQKKKEGSK